MSSGKESFNVRNISLESVVLYSYSYWYIIRPFTDLFPGHWPQARKRAVCYTRTQPPQYLRPDEPPVVPKQVRSPAYHRYSERGDASRPENVGDTLQHHAALRRRHR